MNLFFSYLAVITASYLLGAIPFSLIFAKALKGVDIKEQGSGNIGATNVLVTTGKRAAALAVLFDIGKGFGAVILARLVIGTEISEILAALTAVIGHDFPVYLDFSGGKGISTTAGAIIAMNPYAMGICLLLYVLFLAATRYLILSSLMALAAMPIVFYLLKDGMLYSLYAFFALLLALYAHRDDISRLRSGQEKRISAALDRVV